ncbi:uncharacterized protein (DUF2252 family) [Rhodococcus sp. LBL1]|uniref:Uncharacterized protein (DUF2252 family) n=1 Tax=Prescottella agglutinans TaxID=1644129 RepID=A0ABT6MGA6_9NOCA|nr:DUF2252 domain-containing protein [Prescottella agglutinans]MDH6283353.1 uncharacterized protein (DUF2252 family) [Prescottella agglutinans]MDH6676300.1 uncharacterized protein (DUF2252 family) [Rhodococcus sp. LBL1]MDH6681586.1 uncharacterized protein (DUF2252 family) [Rhodococcus sp. LBL2]
MTDVVDFPTRTDRARRGEDARRRVPFEALVDIGPGAERDPIGLLEEQGRTRVPELLPVRYSRMAVAPFAFLRGGAIVMASDLSRTPHTGLTVQLCGDAHLGNFGIFATPERRLAFDLNDFDETYPGPFEWDVKRLIASFEVACRQLGFGEKRRSRITRACVAEYRETMSRQAAQGNLAVWYSHVDPTTELAQMRDELNSTTRKTSRKLVEKSWRSGSLQALEKLTAVVDGRRRIVSRPPLIVPIEEVFADADADATYRELQARLDEYRATLHHASAVPFGQYEFVQAARKVVGVGSVGTRCWILLMRGADDDDPLVLQAKEAERSVLSRYLDGPSYPSEGQRVVDGQRVMQAASDIFLGWQQGVGYDGVRRDYYVRQLRDAKASVTIEGSTPNGAEIYGRLCGRVLAQAHARSGDRVAIAAYMGSGTGFDEAVTAFARAYADRNARDHATLVAALGSGRVAGE